MTGREKYRNGNNNGKNERDYSKKRVRERGGESHNNERIFSYFLGVHVCKECLGRWCTLTAKYVVKKFNGLTTFFGFMLVSTACNLN